MLDLRDTFFRTLISSSRFNETLFSAFSEAYSVFIRTNLEGNNIARDSPELENIVRSRIRDVFNVRFREEDFVSALSDTVASYSELAKSTGFGQAYQDFSNLWARWNNNLIEPIRDTLCRSPSQKIAQLEKYSLFRYNRITSTSTGGTITASNDKPTNLPPLLIVYAFINRHYILDLVPEVSVVRNLLKQGFDYRSFCK
jgi:polyhydroxyalkanoate synthase